MQIQGTFGPATLRYYSQTILVDLPYSTIEKDPFPTPQEAEVCFLLGEEKVFAFVPLSIVDEEHQTVRVALVGEKEGKVFATLPPTNFGQSSFYASKSDLESVAKPVSIQVVSG